MRVARALLLLLGVSAHPPACQEVTPYYRGLPCTQVSSLGDIAALYDMVRGGRAQG